MLVNGVWFDDDPLPADGGGRFCAPGFDLSRPGDARRRRPASRPRPGATSWSPRRPARGRTAPCLMRKLKRLDGAIPLLESDLPKGEGWAYSRGFDDLAPKGGVFHVHQVYTAARPDYTGRATVPVLWDRRDADDRQQRILRDHPHAELASSTSSAIRPRPLPGGAAPRHRRDQRLRLRQDQQRRLSLRPGQEPGGLRRRLSANCSPALDELETRLGRQRWLVGDRFTEADLRLFPTLVRFDTVYYVLFKCNRRRLADYPNLWNYTREIYQMPGVAETVDFPSIKLGYYGGMRHLNNGILPLGPELDFAAPHDRARFGVVPISCASRRNCRRRRGCGCTTPRRPGARRPAGGSGRTAACRGCATAGR